MFDSLTEWGCEISKDGKDIIPRKYNCSICDIARLDRWVGTTVPVCQSCEPFDVLRVGCKQVHGVPIIRSAGGKNRKSSANS